LAGLSASVIGPLRTPFKPAKARGFLVIFGI
jgi:hypothetical protein